MKTTLTILLTFIVSVSMAQTQPQYSIKIYGGLKAKTKIAPYGKGKVPDSIKISFPRGVGKTLNDSTVMVYPFITILYDNINPDDRLIGGGNSIMISPEEQKRWQAHSDLRSRIFHRPPYDTVKVYLIIAPDVILAGQANLTVANGWKILTSGEYLDDKKKPVKTNVIGSANREEPLFK